ncbi:AraC family transcriptional regulator [Xaviernesmea oryzae]|uniref:AraC family transcriptional regulator n=1 Tax=Xaviernesmea oryzae TaxID=464029 RepID=A0A1Q9B1A3_9HYPH|nr:AraC family transcriptional regulator [Xaviernesmea oryzae]OLP61791.1 AraC family transcriptional regulator [Xaviernesmea oryzae]SEL77260.1 AraC-type DNA-binding protein [Xaviernesmea oryzae]
MDDALSEILRGLRLDGVEYGRCQPSAPWATAYPPQAQAQFHFLAGGAAWLKTPQGEWLELAAGDAVLLPRGDAHVLASAPDVTPVAVGDLRKRQVCDGIVDLQCACADARNLLFFAVMRFNVDPRHPLLQLMPPLMLTSDLAGSEPAIPALLAAMMREVEMQRVGSGGILARLADVLTATIIRAWVEHGCGAATGWLAAVRNPEIGRVLAAIHLEPERDWSVPELARLMGASRSGFAQRFVDVVGETPARYIARMRMHQAHQWLRDGQRVASVANRLGYESEASFSRAFRKIIGMPPSHLRAGRQAAEVVPA